LTSSFDDIKYTQKNQHKLKGKSHHIKQLSYSLCHLHSLKKQRTCIVHCSSCNDRDNSFSCTFYQDYNSCTIYWNVW